MLSLCVLRINLVAVGRALARQNMRWDLLRSLY
jgi:hypothetical protein